MSSLLNTMQSLKVSMKSSVIGACTCRVRFIEWFNTRKYKLTLMSFGFFGLGWTTSGEHHVIGSCVGSSSIMLFATNSLIRFFSLSSRCISTS